MEQIRNYVDAMFSSLPKTAEIEKVKQAMIENLEEKYNALLSEGKNGYEAAGIILSTVGTADELREELGSRKETSDVKIPEQPTALLQPEVTGEFPHTEQQLLEYRSFKTKYNIAIACAVAMFILSPAVHIMLPDSESKSLSYLPMFLMIAIGVGICIYWNCREAYYIQALGFRTKRLTAPVPADDPKLEQFKQFKTRQGIIVAIAVGLFILSPVTYRIGQELTGGNRGGILLMFLSIAAGVALCIFSDSHEDYYKEIFSNKRNRILIKNEAFRFTALFAGIAFSLTTMLYLYLGFAKNLWHPGWIVFPICALLTGICSMIEDYVFSGKEG